MRAILTRLGGFASGTALLGVASLASVPLTIAALGVPGWATFAVAQSLGSIGSVVVGFGWAVTGAAEIALRTPAERAARLVDSLIVRAVLFVLVAAVLAAVTCLGVTPLTPAHLPVAVATSALGLSSSWYFVGAQRAGAYVACEVAPRAVSMLVAPLLAFVWPGQLVMGATLLAGMLVAVAASMSFVRATAPAVSRPAPRVRRRRLATTLRANVVPFASGAVSMAYLNVPTIVIGAIADVRVVAAFGLADRIVKLGLSALTPVVQVAQGWIPQRGSTPAALGARLRRAVMSVAGVSAAAGLFVALAGPWLGAVLSHDALSVGRPLSIAMGAVLACSLVSMCTGPGGLAALGRPSAILASAAGGAVTVAAMIVPLTAWAGAAGGMTAVAAAEVVVLSVQVWAIVRALR